MKRITKWGIAVATILLFTLLFAGCYWTPEEDEGGVTLEIRENGIGASQTANDQRVFFGWVVADDLMRGGEAEVDRAFSEVDTAIEDAFLALETTGDPSSFVINVALPAVQLQAGVFTGNSGSNTFGGLRAGREYLVVVEAFSADYETENYIDGVAFTTVSIEAGESKTVSLEIGDNWVAFDQFLADRYGFLTEPAQIAIFGATGGFYVDFLAGSTPDPPFGTLSSGEYDAWYNSAAVLTPAGEEIDKTGNRTSITADPFVVEGVLPDRAWRLMITSYQDRAATAFNFYLSDPFVTPSGETSSLNFASGSGAAFTYYDVC